MIPLSSPSDALVSASSENLLKLWPQKGTPPRGVCVFAWLDPAADRVIVFARIEDFSIEVARVKGYELMTSGITAEKHTIDWDAFVGAYIRQINTGP